MIRHKRKTLKLGRSLGKMYSSIPIETISNSKDTEDTTTNKNVVDKKVKIYKKKKLITDSYVDSGMLLLLK